MKYFYGLVLALIASANAMADVKSYTCTDAILKIDSAKQLLEYTRAGVTYSGRFEKDNKMYWTEQNDDLPSQFERLTTNSLVNLRISLRSGSVHCENIVP